jgi:hypothetical protein
MALLPTVGDVIYNGIRFSSFAETLRFRATPVPDAAGRTITHTVFEVVIRDRVAGQPADAQVEKMLSALLVPSAGFVYNGRGTGGVRVNLGRVKDFLWGPFPEFVEIKPLGGSNAVRFDWAVRFATLNCGDARYEGPMEFNYDLTFSVDKSGYTRRIYHGHLRIAQTRAKVTDRRIHKSADEFRGDINPPLLENFRRTPGEFKLSPDKCRLDFQVVDEELPPNVPPPGVIDCSAGHDFSTKLAPGAGTAWAGVFTGDYEVAKGVPVSAAYKAFEATLADRVAAARLAIRDDKGRPPTVIPMQARVSEVNLYDKTRVQITLSYTLAVATLPQILAFSGLWRPVPRQFNDWRAWQKSLPRALSERGLAQLKFRPTQDDAILDLCGAKEEIVELKGAPNGFPGELRTTPATAPLDLRRYFPAPTPFDSWLHYRSSVKLEDDHGTVVGNLLPTDAVLSTGGNGGAWDVELQSGANPWGASLSTFPTGQDRTPVPGATDVQLVSGGRPNSQGQNNTSNQGRTTFVQQRTAPTLYVVLSGVAARVGYGIPIPQLLSVNDVPVTICNSPRLGDGFAQEIVGNTATGIPIVGAKWQLRAVLTEVPAGPLPVPPNPLLGA